MRTLKPLVTGKQMLNRIRKAIAEDAAAALVNRCSNEHEHTPMPDGVDQLNFSEWAAEMNKTHRQTQCQSCKLWTIWVPRKSS